MDSGLRAAIGNSPRYGRAGDAFGNSVAVGDYNADGFADLAIGVSNRDVAEVDRAGEVNVLYGSAAGPITDAVTVLCQAGPIPGEPEVFDRFGSMLLAGDFNGDGVDDLAIGVPSEGLRSSPTPTRTDPGVVPYK